MRGKVPDVALELFELGITPAYAGKRPRQMPLVRSAGDHPRICGEKSFSVPCA